MNVKVNIENKVFNEVWKKTFYTIRAYSGQYPDRWIYYKVKDIFESLFSEMKHFRSKMLIKHLYEKYSK
jgi:hypothetical protein